MCTGIVSPCTAVHEERTSCLASFLQAVLPADGRRGVRAEQCVKASQLLDELLLVITQQRALRRVFASVKGYYFQVQLLGHLVTFLMPHPFKQVKRISSQEMWYLGRPGLGLVRIPGCPAGGEAFVPCRQVLVG